MSVKLIDVDSGELLRGENKDDHSQRRIKSIKTD